MLSAFQLINIMKETGKKLSELANELSIYPQILKNIRVNDKNRALNNPKILDEIDRVKQELGESGRVLVRPSGTESLVRIIDRKSTRLNSSHVAISYAVFCLKKKEKQP